MIRKSGNHFCGKIMLTRARWPQPGKAQTVNGGGGKLH